MSRLPAVHRDDLDEGGQQVWDGIVDTRGGGLIDKEGALVGPFNAFVTAPDVGRRLSDLGRVLRFETSIERRLLEIAIITMGARWKAEFEWWAHARMALDHGVSKVAVDAIGAGETPPFETSEELTVYRFARELADSGRVGDDTYRAGRELLGDIGVVELVSLCGYYTLISFLLNTFEVPLPPGAAPMWES
jgi:4-carboxymuconolactone decarboxylase